MTSGRFLGRLRARPTDTGVAMPAAPVADHDDGRAWVDLARLIAAVDPRYLDTALVPDPHVMRCSGLAFARGEGRLYVLYAGSYLFYSDDGLR